MHEVAVTTAYTGAKMQDDENAIARIPTIDEDESHLQRFWEECRSEICQELIGIVSDEQMDTNNEKYELKLNVSQSFDTTLTAGMQLSLFSYFVHAITAKWYVYTNKQDAGAYADKAAILLDDIHRKAIHKKHPVRPTYNN